MTGRWRNVATEGDNFDSGLYGVILVFLVGDHSQAVFILVIKANKLCV